jgi:hypothetical protein
MGYCSEKFRFLLRDDKEPLEISEQEGTINKAVGFQKAGQGEACRHKGIGKESIVVVGQRRFHRKKNFIILVAEILKSGVVM